MLLRLAKPILRRFQEQIGWKTSRQIVVFAVDDYGLTYRSLNASSGYATRGSSFFLKNDSLESPIDMTNLYEVLSKHKDKAGSHCVFTPFVVVSNPELNTNLLDGAPYKVTDFWNTLDMFYGSKGVSAWRQGIQDKFLSPEFHAREHFNLEAWLTEIKMSSSICREGLMNGVLDFAPHVLSKSRHLKFAAAFDFKSENDFKNKDRILSDGLMQFEKAFQRTATCFTPPAGGYSYKFEPTLLKHGVKAVSLGSTHRVTLPNGKKQLTRFHWIGKKSSSGITYVPRNALFEPHNPKIDDWIDRCLNDVNRAFRSRKPAIISSHRINFVNNDNPANGQGLKKLDLLLKRLVAAWPEIEFISFQQLIADIQKEASS